MTRIKHIIMERKKIYYIIDAKQVCYTSGTEKILSDSGIP